MKIIYFFAAFVLLHSCNNSQPATHEELKKIAEVLHAPPPAIVTPDYNKQLDSIDNYLEKCTTAPNAYLVGCLQEYNDLMDSMLIVVGKTFYTTLGDSAKNAFSKEETTWKKLLLKKEKELDAAYEAQGGGERDLFFQDRGEFVNKRIKALIKRIK